MARNTGHLNSPWIALCCCGIRCGRYHGPPGDCRGHSHGTVERAVRTLGRQSDPLSVASGTELNISSQALAESRGNAASKSYGPVEQDACTPACRPPDST
jgi:hypothetical protein